MNNGRKGSICESGKRRELSGWEGSVLLWNRERYVDRRMLEVIVPRRGRSGFELCRREGRRQRGVLRWEARGI